MQWLQNLLNWIVETDKQIFIFVNSTLSNSFFDLVLPFFRQANNWIFLYVIILILAIAQYKRKIWFWILFALLSILITDQTSSHIFKPLFQRLRPCSDPNFLMHVKLRVTHCSGGFSFTSSHATNHFGIAIFFIGTLNFCRKYRFFLLFWATCIAFAQVYVGVHYPLDVLCGTVLGIFLGKLINFIYTHFYKNI